MLMPMFPLISIILLRKAMVPLITPSASLDAYANGIT